MVAMFIKNILKQVYVSKKLYFTHTYHIYAYCYEEVFSLNFTGNPMQSPMLSGITLAPLGSGDPGTLSHP